jgi:hypothetical protein
MKQAAESPEGIKYRWLCGQARAMKLWEEHAALVKTLHDYHSTADLDHMVAQLKGEEPSSQILAPVKHVIPDCNWLAGNLFDPVTDESFANIVETMSRLCSQSEGKGRWNSSGPGHDVNSLMHSPMPCDSPPKPLLASDAHVRPTQLAIKAARPGQSDRAAATTEVAIPPTIPQT